MRIVPNGFCSGRGLGFGVRDACGPGWTCRSWSAYSRWWWRSNRSSYDYSRSFGISRSITKTCKQRRNVESIYTDISTTLTTPVLARLPVPASLPLSSPFLLCLLLVRLPPVLPTHGGGGNPSPTEISPETVFVCVCPSECIPSYPRSLWSWSSTTGLGPHPRLVSVTGT